MGEIERGIEREREGEGVVLGGVEGAEREREALGATGMLEPR